ncbi:reverse transcriptase-rnase h-integrase [Moniliophthora roreri MCA 2997]|uniref:Reverse transcriptase-rnase h-integrase n=1 Tax=Moniliophthora roreri (strain MCA 2997) TaxID=1381753 RepID=V2WYL2_MONRO|nr:reverse transcriptase-rnase h-integrase [Moniliophthora roreri MCA 2997]
MLGKQMTQADALSRQSNEKDEEDVNNNNIILLPDYLFIKGVNIELAEEVQKRLGLDDFHKSTLDMLLTQGMLPIKSALSDWEIKDDLLFFKDRVYVLKDNELHRSIVKEIYKERGVGHSGQ